MCFLTRFYGNSLRCLYIYICVSQNREVLIVLMIDNTQSHLNISPCIRWQQDVINIPIIPSKQAAQYSACDVTALPTSPEHHEYACLTFASWIMSWSMSMSQLKAIKCRSSLKPGTHRLHMHLRLRDSVLPMHGQSPHEQWMRYSYSVCVLALHTI